MDGPARNPSFLVSSSCSAFLVGKQKLGITRQNILNAAIWDMHLSVSSQVISVGSVCAGQDVLEKYLEPVVFWRHKTLETRILTKK